MVPFIFLVDDVQLDSPIPVGAGSIHVRRMTLSHSSTGKRYEWEDVHVSLELRSALEQSGEREVHLIVIDRNSLASHLLPSRPQCLVTGVDRLNGTRHAGLPRKFHAWRRWGTSAFVALMVTLVSIESGWWTPLVSAGAALMLLTFARLPKNAFLGHEDEMQSAGIVAGKTSLFSVPSDGLYPRSAAPGLPANRPPNCREGRDAR